jgi:hypothetical protein
MLMPVLQLLLLLPLLLLRVELLLLLNICCRELYPGCHIKHHWQHPPILTAAHNCSAAVADSVFSFPMCCCC